MLSNLSNPLLTHHAVLQRGTSIPVCATAAPGAAVTLTFLNQKYATTAGSDGVWSITLPPLPAGGPHILTLSVNGQETILRDILIGDVWVSSGQSNMEMALKDCDTADVQLHAAQNPNLRLFNVARNTSLTPLRFLQAGQWTPSTPASAAIFSAIGFMFGQELQRSTGVPIGLINASVGATPCETWLSRATLEADPSFAPVFERFNQSLAVFPDPQKTYSAAFTQWDAETDLAEREGRRLPGPQPRLISANDKWAPGACFHAMVAPLTHTPVRGIIWYQGAGAPDRAYQYRRMFQLLITDWRRHWAMPDLPFYFVQEARFGPRREFPCEHSWAELREAQAMALRLPHTAMAVAIDTGDAADIHPRDKAPLAHRLALIARARLYAQDIPHQSPELDRMEIDGPAIRLHFKHTQGQLLTSDQLSPTGFAISAGPGDTTRGHRGFQWAQAVISGNTITLTCPSIPRPVAARYAWAQNPVCNVINAAGLPLGPFRTDDWPGVTMGIE
jgi:sialate O-acetylesterase